MKINVFTPPGSIPAKVRIISEQGRFGGRWMAVREDKVLASGDVASLAQRFRSSEA